MALSNISVAFEVVTPSLMTSNVTPILLLTSGNNNIKEATLFLFKYFIWIVFAIGFPGNLISLIVIVCMSRYQLTTSLLYVGLLAVVDNMAIILKIIKNQTITKELSVNETGCQFLYFFGLTLTSYANWILVVMSAERFTAVVFPLKVKLFWSLRRSVMTIGTVLLFLSIVHVHIFFTITEIRTSCIPHRKYQRFFKIWWFPISSSIYALIPAILITFFNVVIIVFLRRSTSHRRSLRPDTDPSTRGRRQERQITTMLVTLSIIFIVVTLPRCIYVISHKYWKTDQRMWKRFTQVLTSNLCDLNHAVNFYLYFCTGKRFRRYCFQMIRCNLSRLTEGCSWNTVLVPNRFRQSETGL